MRLRSPLVSNVEPKDTSTGRKRKPSKNSKQRPAKSVEMLTGLTLSQISRKRQNKNSADYKKARESLADEKAVPREVPFDSSSMVKEPDKKVWDKKGSSAPRDDYSPVYCKRCKVELYQLVNVVVKAPLGWRRFTKRGLRAQEVTVTGVNYDDMQWFCDCPVTTPGKIKAVSPELRRKTVAGYRWAGKPAPKEIDPRGRNPSPVSPDDPS